MIWQPFRMKLQDDCMDKIIEVKNVSMGYRVDSNKVNTLKEWAVTKLKRELHYEMFWALSDVSFDVDRGEVVGIIGRNGAGKSTILKIISGLFKPTEGSVVTNGRVVPMLELGSGFDPELTGRENIFLNGAILGYTEKFLNEQYDNILEFSELQEFIDRPIKTYSSGMMMRLAFSVATIVKPEILIVDEILAVGDDAFQRKSHAKMMELMHGGATVLYVSHNLNQIRDLCNKVVWLDHGKVVMQGDTEKVCDAYQNS